MNKWPWLFICVWALQSQFVVAKTESKIGQHEVRQGILDLRHATFDAESNIKLHGDWQFAWRQLISADQSMPEIYAQVPLIWNKLNGENIGFATYRITILLPKNTPALGLLIPVQYSAWRLFANGELIDSVGLLATNKAQEQAVFIRKIVPLPDTELIELNWQISNFYYWHGGPKTPITLGNLATLLNQDNKTIHSTLLFVGGYLLLAFYHLLMYGLHRKETAYFLFGLMTFAIGLRLFFINQLAITYWPDIAYDIWQRLIMVCNWWVVPLYLAFLTRIFPSSFNKTISRLSIASAVAMVIFIYTFGSYAEAKYRFVILIINALQLGYILFALIRAKRRQESYAGFTLIAALVLASSLIHDIIVQLLNSYDFYLSVWGMLLWAIAHAILLGDRTHRAYQSEEQLNEQLQNRINEKTSELADKISELETAHQVAEQNNQAKTNFLAVLSHELRTPLNGILGATQAIKLSLLDKSQQNSINLLHDTGKQLNTLVEQLLDLARIERGDFALKPAPFSPLNLVTQVVELHTPSAKNKGIDLKYQTHNLPLWLSGDAVRIKQVLLNIVENAIKYTEQGSVLLTCTSKEQHNGICELIFSITDTGSGIPEILQHQIFKPFFQINQASSRHYQGSGLGLSVCSTLVEMMGGQISLISEIGQGTCFTINLPLIETTEPQAENLVLPSPGKKILLIDDDPLNHQVMSQLCDRLNISLKSAYSGEQALKMLSPDYHWLLIDIQMQDMTGEQLVTIIRTLPDKQLAELPVAAFTALLMPENIQSYQKHFDAILPKPVLLADLCALLNGAKPLNNDKQLPQPLKTQSLEQIKKDLGAVCFNDFLSASIASIKQSVEQIIQAETDEVARFAAHRLKSAAATLGLNELVSIAGDWENGVGALDKLQLEAEQSLLHLSHLT